VVAEDVRRRLALTPGDVLLALVQLLVGGVAGYALGVRQDREQTLYQERSKSAVELRNRLRAIRALLRDDLLPLLELDSKGLLEDPQLEDFKRRESYVPDVESYFEALSDIGEHTQAMQGYMEAQTPWLEPSTQRLYHDVVGDVQERLSRFQRALVRSLNPRVDQPRNDERKRAADNLRKWISGEGHPGLDGLLEKWDEEVERVLGFRPRWRRMFGA
jgi:hypothetical protein